MEIISVIKSKLNSKLSSDIIWTFSIQFVIMLCLFITNKVLCNKLDVDTFGQYNIAKRSVAVISMTMLSGIGITIPRYLSLYLGKNDFYRAAIFLKSTLLFFLIISLIVSLVGFIFRVNLQNIVADSNDFILYVVIFLYSFATACISLLYAYYRGISNFKKYNIFQFVTQIALIIPILCINKLTLTLIFELWSVITLIILITFTIIERNNNKFIFNKDEKILELKTEFKTVAVYSLPRLIGDFVLFTFSAFPLIFIKIHFDLKTVAYYSVGITIVNMALPFFSILGTILLPYVSELLSKNKLDMANSFINKLFAIYLLFGTFIIILFYFLTNFLITIFFSNEYLEAASITRILILSILPQAVYLLYRNPIDAVSVFPFNTINLSVSFLIMVILFNLYSDNITQLSWIYLIVSVFQGIISAVIWYTLKNKTCSSK